jgi:hypothetical protein
MQKQTAAQHDIRIDREPIIAHLINIDRVNLFHATRYNRTQRLDGTFVIFVFLCFLAEPAYIALLCKIHIFGPTTLHVTHTGTLCYKAFGVRFMFRPNKADIPIVKLFSARELQL